MVGIGVRLPVSDVQEVHVRPDRPFAVAGHGSIPASVVYRVFFLQACQPFSLSAIHRQFQSVVFPPGYQGPVRKQPDVLRLQLRDHNNPEPRIPRFRRFAKGQFCGVSWPVFHPGIQGVSPTFRLHPYLDLSKGVWWLWKTLPRQNCHDTIRGHQPGQQIGCLVQGGFQFAIQLLKIERFHEQVNIGSATLQPRRCHLQG